MRPVRNVFQKLSRTEQRREGVVAYLCSPPSQTKCTLCTDSMWLWGGGGVELYCGPYSAGVLHSVSDQIQNLQNCYTTPKQK